MCMILCACYYVVFLLITSCLNTVIYKYLFVVADCGFQIMHLGQLRIWTIEDLLYWQIASYMLINKITRRTFGELAN